MASKNDTETARDAARAAAAGSPIDDFVERLAERVGAKATVNAVFGEPIERDGITVIPVAKVRWGFGGGAGSGSVMGGPGSASEDGTDAEPRAGSGQGGGGGATAEPVGWLEIGPDGASFNPIVPAMPSPGFLLAAGATAALVLRALARLFRR
jgi:uncharacterized spore protein YtfJ